MLSKLKEISEIHEYLASIKESLQKLHEESTSHHEELAGLRSSISGLKEDLAEQKEHVHEFSEVVAGIRNLKDDLHKEAHEFKVLKTQTQRKIMEKFEEDLGAELKKHSESLRQDMQTYLNLRKDVAIIASDMKVASNELEKFTAIAKHIQETDFHLNKYARRLAESDNEKLKLLQRIDNLERLVSKLRRHKP